MALPILRWRNFPLIVGASAAQIKREFASMSVVTPAISVTSATQSGKDVVIVLAAAAPYLTRDNYVTFASVTGLGTTSYKVKLVTSMTQFTIDTATSAGYASGGTATISGLVKLTVTGHRLRVGDLVACRLFDAPDMNTSKRITAVVDANTICVENATQPVTMTSAVIADLLLCQRVVFRAKSTNTGSPILIGTDAYNTDWASLAANGTVEFIAPQGARFSLSSFWASCATATQTLEILYI